MIERIYYKIEKREGGHVYKIPSIDELMLKINEIIEHINEMEK